MSGNARFFGSVHAKLLIWLGKNGKLEYVVRFVRKMKVVIRYKIMQVLGNGVCAKLLILLLFIYKKKKKNREKNGFVRLYAVF